MKHFVLSAATILIAIAAITAGCGGPGQNDIEDKEWVLESYGQSGSLTRVIEGSRVTATFDSGDNQVTGSAGCNSYFGGYTLGGDELTVLQLAYTEMACLEPEGVMKQEQEFLRLLAGAESYSVEAGTLRINCSGGVLVFSAAE